MIITSTHNPKIQFALSLRNRRDRDQENCFLIEGYRELLRALNGNFAINTLFFCPECFLKDNEEKLIQEAEKTGAILFECSKKVFEKLSYRDRPDGLLAIAPMFKNSLEDLEKIFDQKKDPLFVIAESIEKPGNLGTILRSSDGVLADGVIVCDPKTDVFNPNVVRSSIGTLFTQKVIQAPSEEVFHFLREKSCKIVAATPHADLEYTEADLLGPIAIAVGTEQVGLSDLWMKGADIQVRIPMLGVSDSLNVATATTLLLYEVLRQKRANRSL
jgi:RNA methyltransferase, TrmH family